MATEAQITFFDQLLDEKDFGDKDRKALAKDFADLNIRSASAWIDRAMALPRVPVGSQDLTEPAF